MKKQRKKILAVVLLACLVAGSIPAQSLMAETTGDDGAMTSVDTSKIAGTVTDFEQEDAGQEIDAEEIVWDYDLHYMVVASPYLETPGTQQIVVAYEDETTEVETMALTVREDATGEVSEWMLSEREDTLYLFEQTFEDADATGTYEVLSITVTGDTGDTVLVLADYGMSVQFGVNVEYEGYEELQPLDSGDAALDDEVEMTVVSLDEDTSDDEAAAQISGALEAAEEEIEAETGIATYSEVNTLKSSSGNYVVAIDPGHDSTHTGATSSIDSSLKEHELTLKIANYCKEELETYSNVTVYMTRTSAACPYPSTSSSGADIGKRVDAAVAQGADVFVSIHLNSASSSSAKGAEVIIPNTNGTDENPSYGASVNAESKTLAESILSELSDIGVTMRSNKIYTKDASEDKYDDGTAMDYYAVARHSKEYGIPGIIVEHAFLSNSSDVSNYLNSEAGLKKLGVADATGIANYLGLTAGFTTPTLKSATAQSDGTIKVTWNAVDEADGYRVYRKTSGGSWSGVANVTDGSTTSYTDSSNLTDGTKYYYTVRAWKGTWSEASAHQYESSYWSGYNSSGVSATAAYGLSTPSLKSVTSSEGTNTVTWSAVSGAGGYRVYRKTSGGSWSGIGNTENTSYADSSATSGTKYYYTVRAYTNWSDASANQYGTPYWSGYNSSGLSVTTTATLDIPSLKSATAQSNGTIKVTWSAVSGATGYRVYRKTSGGSWKGLGNVTDGSASYTDNSNLTNGTKYYYTVRAWKGTWSEASAHQYESSYWSGYNSSGVSATAAYGLSTPSLKSVTSSEGTNTVTWSAVSGAGGYRVYRKTSGGSWSGIGNTENTSYADSSATSGTKYYYTVRAYTNWSDASANQYGTPYWSGYNSSGVSITTTVPVDTPSLKSATAQSDGTIKVTWSAVSGATGYRVYRKTSGGSWSGLANVTDGSTSYIDSSDLTNGTKYIYTVRAWKGDWSEVSAHQYEAAYWSSYNSSGVSATAAYGLSTPSLKSATVSGGAIEVKWSSVSGATGYRVYRKTSGGSWSSIGNVTDGSTSYTDTNVNVGTKYYYTVRAWKGTWADASSHQFATVYWSNHNTSGVSATVLSTLSTPSLTGTSIASNGIKVTWKSVSEATGYRVYRKTSGGSWSGLGNTSNTYYVDTNGGSSGTTYYYTVRAYRDTWANASANQYDAQYWSSYDSSGVSGSAYEIMGTSSSRATVTNMVAMFTSAGYTEPASGASYTIEELAQIYIDEAKAEGVKAEVAWCQMIHETGYLQFTGDVKASQNNFAGIGATGNGEAGNTFSTPTEGVQAQIQHLKAYASTDALNNTCVDPRFSYVTRGSAKYVEILGSQANPSGVGWATSANYGTNIVNLINKL